MPSPQPPQRRQKRTVLKQIIRKRRMEFALVIVINACMQQERGPALLSPRMCRAGAVVSPADTGAGVPFGTPARPERDAMHASRKGRDGPSRRPAIADLHRDLHRVFAGAGVVFGCGVVLDALEAGIESATGDAEELGGFGLVAGGAGQGFVDQLALEVVDGKAGLKEVTGRT